MECLPSPGVNGQRQHFVAVEFFALELRTALASSLAAEQIFGAGWLVVAFER